MKRDSTHYGDSRDDGNGLEGAVYGFLFLGVGAFLLWLMWKVWLLMWLIVKIWG